MSGNPTSNVVPMAKAPAPATAPPQMPMPMPSMWGAGGSLPWGPGCCPPGGMDALLKCYCDVQAATAFICSVMVQCVQTNPAVVAAIIAAIEASGSSLPLTGVTNGTDAQPGQVGEWVIFDQSVNFTAAAQTQTITMGVLQPGDWDFWIYANCPSPVVAINISLEPSPVGMSGQPQGFFITDASSPTAQVVCLGPQARLLISVPTLIPVLVLTNQNAAGPGPGTMSLIFSARRRR